MGLEIFFGGAHLLVWGLQWLDISLSCKGSVPGNKPSTTFGISSLIPEQPFFLGGGVSMSVTKKLNLSPETKVLPSTVDMILISYVMEITSSPPNKDNMVLPTSMFQHLNVLVRCILDGGSKYVFFHLSIFTHRIPQFDLPPYFSKWMVQPMVFFLH